MTITVRRFKPCFRSVERVNRTTNRLNVNPAEPMTNRIPNQLREYNSVVLVPATGRLMNPATMARAMSTGWYTLQAGNTRVTKAAMTKGDKR